MKKHILIPFAIEMCQQCMYLGEITYRKDEEGELSFMCCHPKGERKLVARVHVSELSRKHAFYIPEWCPMEDNEIWDTSGKKKQTVRKY